MLKCSPTNEIMVIVDGGFKKKEDLICQNKKQQPYILINYFYWLVNSRNLE